jgi:pyruvate dehydrogenase E1 component beta subunit
MVQASLEAAEDLFSDGISVEVIDPRTLSPLDLQAIAASVKKTSRLVIVHEAVEQGGIGAEIATRVQREAFYYLDSPILRIAAPNAPVPFTPTLEREFVPGRERIVEAIGKLVNKA